MTFYIIAGEASGDLHGSNLVKALKSMAPASTFRGWGGDLMEKAGVELVKHIEELAFMGFAEVVMNLRTILNNLKHCKRDLENSRPDALILIDYPGFNLRIAPFAKELGIPVFYYISPQIWAWKSGRVHKIAQNTDVVYTILPFEQEFYAGYGYEVEYVGHPLLDAVELPESDGHEALDSDVIALLPGSRKQEIETMLPIMASILDDFPSFRFIIAKAPSIPVSFYQPFLEDGRLELHEGHAYDLLKSARAALVTSGTATLETALLDVPQVVCYKGNPISYQIARRVVKVSYISLVNLIMDSPVLKELIQGELNRKSLVDALRPLIEFGPERKKMIETYGRLREELGGPGASTRCAQSMLKKLGYSMPADESLH